MEELVGRKLEEWEEVHHRDRNPRNNLPENLEVLDAGKHREVHKKMREEIAGPARAICAECGMVFFVDEIKNGWRSKARFCSHECRQTGRIKQRAIGGAVEDSHTRQNRLDRKINIKQLAIHLKPT